MFVLYMIDLNAILNELIKNKRKEEHFRVYNKLHKKLTIREFKLKIKNEQ